MQTGALPISKDKKYLTCEAFVASEEDKNTLLHAAKIIESYCNKSDKKFTSYQDKLKHVASLLPPVFTKESSFKRSHLKLA